ncbi:MAG: LacI family DNA-binding transcriptional regulator [Anaerolineales bacterium]|nr:LacI family DNA-binding transcriptional regulator [Anaerolineales bacterium]
MTRPSSSITIRDVARQAGVSVATVSRFINHTAPTSPEVSERIRRVMEQLNYAPHATARQLATRKTQAIGLLLTNMHNDFFAPLLSGIESVVSTNGYNLLVATYRPGLRKHHWPPVGMHNSDGLLVFADSLADEEIISFYEKKFPLVLVHRSAPPGFPIPCVTVENRAAAFKIVDHLVAQHGKRRIVFMRGPAQQEDSHWREAGYRIALEAHGIPCDDHLILSGEFEREIAYASMKKFLKNSADFDAVFAGDDDSAIGVLKALKEFGIRVPEDVAVAGFDDMRQALYLTPPLTTVRAPTEQVGVVAAQQLFCLLNDKTPELITLLPTEIVLRRSCGCSYEPDSM